MSDVTIVHLLRHGEVENPGGIVYGRLPGYHLSANGRAMAAAAADYFADRITVAPQDWHMMQPFFTRPGTADGSRAGGGR